MHQLVRRLRRTVGYRLSPRARKKIEELWGKVEMLARVPAVPTPGTVAGPREGLSFGLAAESEAAGDLLLAPA